MNRWVDINKICTDVILGHGEELIRFFDLDLIFKVTAGLKLPNVSPKRLVCTISHDWLADFNQICMDITLGQDEELICIL